MPSQHPYHSFGRNPQEGLEKFTVQISRLGEEAALGTGILVTNGGLIATCYHVIKSIVKSKSAGSSSSKKYVSVSFSDGSIKLEAEIRECREDLDVAILKIDKIPDGYEEAKLGIRTYDYIGHRFVSRGYRKNERYSHLPSNGTISDIVYSKDWSTEVIRLESTNYGETGMSGSAVYDVDIKSGLVVGMMRFHDEDESGVDDKAPYAIPVPDIMRCCPEIEKENRGLLVYEFLNMIESFDYQSYKDIDHLWVAPKEYEKTIQTLERDRVVIITGPPEYGKTYTAIRTLWEYYHKGYISKLLEIEDTAVEKTGFRKTINEILDVASQKKNIVVYLDDPFGKREFVKEHVKEVKELLVKLKVYKNARLIITSRESNYRQIDDPFFKEIENIIKFDIARPSYDPKRRENILRVHAQSIGCAWIKNKGTTSTILSLLREDPKNLPTLLNILNFVQQTVDEKGDDLDKLKNKMRALSEETPRAFAKEIKSEHSDLMEFLSFPFISDSLKKEPVISHYEELIRDKKYSERYSFEHIAEIFKDKISTDGYVRFRHPSYSEALPYVLESKYNTVLDRQKSHPTTEVFSKVILKLVDDYRTPRYVATGIEAYQLPPDMLSVARDVFHAATSNFDKLPPDVRNQLLLKLADSGFAWVIHFVANVIASDFDKLPSHVPRPYF